METLVMLLLLFYAQQNSAFKETLKKVLSLYKENRELLRSMTEMFDTSSKNKDGLPPEGTQKGSPDKSGESLRAFENFLEQI